MAFVAKSVYLITARFKGLPIPLRWPGVPIAVATAAGLPTVAPAQTTDETEQRTLVMRSLESYTILGLLSSLYAVGLNTKVGKKFTEEYTWASVCIGTSIVLAVLRLMLPKDHWLKLMTAFTVAGFPMVARSLYNKTVRELETNEEHF
jgi:hypothetical protein